MWMLWGDWSRPMTLKVASTNGFHFHDDFTYWWLWTRIYMIHVNPVRFLNSLVHKSKSRKVLYAHMLWLDFNEFQFLLNRWWHQTIRQVPELSKCGFLSVGLSSLAPVEIERFGHRIINSGSMLGAPGVSVYFLSHSKQRTFCSISMSPLRPARVGFETVCTYGLHICPSKVCGA